MKKAINYIYENGEYHLYYKGCYYDCYNSREEMEQDIKWLKWEMETGI